MARYFDESGRSPFGGPRLWAKSIVIGLVMAGAWAFFMFGPGGVLVTVACALVSSFGLAGLGFCVMHDASHGAYSSRPGVNRMLARVLDLIGGSSHIWRLKHNVVHHTYPNLVGIDQDIEAGALLRLAPGQRWLFFHRFQHVYVWLLYALFGVKWVWFDDFYNIATGKIGAHRLPRPRGREWLYFLGGKAFVFTWSFVLPVIAHGWAIGLLFHLTMQVATGLTLTVVFQLAHCVEEADFPEVPTPAGSSTEWAVHQLNTSVDFAPGSPVTTWYLGGLNYQAVHHLFPHVSHVHYPALATIVAQTCRDHGVRYRVNRSCYRALRSHLRWLREMGRRPARVAGVM